MHAAGAFRPWLFYQPEEPAKERIMQADGGNLFRAQAALSFLGHVTACYNGNEADSPPENFGFELSTILRYIEDEITAAESGQTEKGKAEKTA